MTTRTIALVAVLTALMLGACSKKEVDPALCGPADDSIAASCHLPDGSCWDLVCKSLNDNGVCFAEDGQYKDRESCEKTQKGIFARGCTCKREGSMGGCRTSKEADRSVTKWTYSGLTRAAPESLRNQRVQHLLHTVTMGLAG